MKVSGEFGIEMQDFQGLMKRSVALLDLDHTLVYSAKGGKLKINKKLLQALEAKGIKDVYLFTDMTISAGSIEDRLKIIKKLEKRGFSVHGVITPLDYFWSTSRTVLEKLDREFVASKIIMREGAQKNMSEIPDVVSKFEEIKDRVQSNDFPKFGLAFEEAKKIFLIEDENLRRSEMAKLMEHSVGCKTAIDAISYLRGFSSGKALMCLQFLFHLPSWVLSIDFFDDKIENIDAVKEAGEVLKFPVPFKAYHGEFNERGDTFSEQFAPDLFPKSLQVEAPAKKDSEVELSARMRDIVTRAQKKIKELQNSETFGTFRLKKEYTQAKALYREIVETHDTFVGQWNCVLAHLRTLSKNRKGVYQLSVFDIELLELLSADPLVISKINAVHRGPLNSAVVNLGQSVDKQLLIRRVLGEAEIKKEKFSLGGLSASMGSVPALKVNRRSALEPMKKKPPSGEQPSQGRFFDRTRKRSLTADSAPNLDILKPSPYLPRGPNTSANESPKPLESPDYSDSAQDPSEVRDEVSNGSGLK